VVVELEENLKQLILVLMGQLILVVEEEVALELLLVVLVVLV